MLSKSHISPGSLARRLVTPCGSRSGSPRRLARRRRFLPAVGPVHVVAGLVLVAAEDLALPGRGFCRG
jgi:hypothetical protein